MESFNGKFRDGCMNENWFMSVEDAKTKIEAWPGPTRSNAKGGRCALWDRTRSASASDRYVLPRDPRGIVRSLPRLFDLSGSIRDGGPL